MKLLTIRNHLLSPDKIVDLTPIRTALFLLILVPDIMCGQSCHDDVSCPPVFTCPSTRDVSSELNNRNVSGTSALSSQGSPASNSPSQSLTSLSCVNMSETSEAQCGCACDFDELSAGVAAAPEAVCNLWRRHLLRFSMVSDGVHDAVPGFIVTNGEASYDEDTTRGGPPVDFSTGTSKGFYALFIGDSKSSMSATARLTSPVFASSLSAFCAVHFAVNMFGDDVPQLGVFIERTDRKRFRLLRVVGDKGSSWTSYIVPLGVIRMPFQISFEASRGAGDTGHVALDDFGFLNCTLSDNEPGQGKQAVDCKTSEFRCSSQLCVNKSALCDMEDDCLDGDDESPDVCEPSVLFASGRCNFERGLCGWKPDDSDIGSWKRESGQTMQLPSGPTEDHTTQSGDGHFVFAQVSRTGSVFLKSPLLRPPPNSTYNTTSPLYNSCQLRFFYYMHGAHVHGLFVHLLEISVTCPSCGRKYESYIKIYPTGLYGSNAWHRASFPLPLLTRRFIVKFEAVTGLRVQGTVAVDDVSLSPECYLITAAAATGAFFTFANGCHSPCEVCLNNWCSARPAA